MAKAGVSRAPRGVALDLGQIASPTWPQKTLQSGRKISGNGLGRVPSPRRASSGGKISLGVNQRFQTVATAIGGAIGLSSP